MSLKKFYVTTPIYYVNDKPHIGHFYTTLVADILARWYRLKGYDVFFLTGTDENSQKNVEAAKKAGKEVRVYVDEMADLWKKTWQDLGISFTDFIRTTEERHAKGVTKFFKMVYENGDIYRGKYIGYYCTGCEAFVKKSDLVNGKCPVHKKEPIRLEEENYFFRANKYKQKLLNYIRQHPEFIQPAERRREVISYIIEAFEDISISRQKQKWGIKIPIDETQRVYVWFDALLNYLTGIGFGWNEEKFKTYWPANLHLIGKDIIKFHCALWPAMLLSAGLPLPNRVFAHGFFTVEGEKISKSLGNAIDPLELIKKYPRDALRYFLIREIPLGEDGDFSEEKLVMRINGELVNDLGNLVYRVLSLTEKYDGKIVGERELDEKLRVELIEELMERLNLHEALNEIWNFIRATNKYINEKEAWKLEGDELGNALYNLLEALRVISILLSPFLPDTAEKIREQLGVKEGRLSDCKFGEFRGNPKKGEYLFKKVKIKR